MGASPPDIRRSRVQHGRVGTTGAADEPARLVEGRPPADREALGESLARRREALVGYLYNQVHDEQLAEDLAHDVLVRALDHLDEVDPDRPLWPWLATIARNRLIDHYRRSGTAREAADDPRVTETLSPGGTASDMSEFGDPGLRLEERELLQLALRPLSRRQRSALLLHHAQDWSSDQLAELYGRDRNAVHQLLYRARGAARKEYVRLTGDSGPKALLPWPVIWAYGLARRASARTRRLVQDWQLALPAAGESMAGVAVVATVSVGAGLMWPTGSSAQTLPPVDLDRATLTASAEAAAPDLHIDGGDDVGDRAGRGAAWEEFDHADERLTAAISRAEAEALQIRPQGAGDGGGNDAHANDSGLSDASIESPDASVESSLRRSEDSGFDDGQRLEDRTELYVDAGPVSREPQTNGHIDQSCEYTTGSLYCDATETSNEDPSPDSVEGTSQAIEDTTPEATDTSSGDVATDSGDGDASEAGSEAMDDMESVEALTDDNCGLSDTTETACGAAESTV